MVPARLDLSTLFTLAVPACVADCHPIPGSWVAKWVAILSPDQERMGLLIWRVKFR
jgi:hypothetical protein